MRKVQAYRDSRTLQDLAVGTSPSKVSVIRRGTYRDRLGDPAPPTEFEIRVRNWQRAQRWIRPSDTSYTFPAYRYARSPIGAEVEYLTGEALTRAPDPIDWADAWEVELTWRGLPPKPRWVLKMDLHLRKNPKHACRLLRRCLVFIRYDDWESELEKALTELQFELDMRKLEARSMPMASSFLMPA